jgi:predicted Rossmann-fold nucleotide-binding protein
VIAVPPSALYTPTDLFGEFDPADERCWAESFDGRTYLAYRRGGGRTTRDAAASTAQADHDAAVSRLLGDAHADRRSVAIMGGHRMERGAPAYLGVATIAWRLAGEGFLVLTGGGPGAMEAAHLGARLAGCDLSDVAEAVRQLAADPRTRRFPPVTSATLIARGAFVADQLSLLHTWQVPAFALAADLPDGQDTGIGIPTWLFGHEPPTPLAPRHAKYFENSIREDGLLAAATSGVVYASGAAGTLQEIYTDAAQNFYRTVDDRFSPMVFLDTDGIWTATYGVDAALRALFRHEDYERYVTFTTRVEDVVPALLRSLDGPPAATAVRTSS